MASWPTSPRCRRDTSVPNSFIGTMTTTGLGLCPAVGGFAMASPSLTHINLEIGLVPNSVWVGLIYIFMLAVGLVLWFFICSACLAVVGRIVAATAQAVPALIGSIAFQGVGGPGQQSFAFITAGLRWCFWVLLIVNFLSDPCFYLFCPPNFKMKFQGRTRTQQIKSFDYIGTFLTVSGLLLFLIGLTWGGTVHPWNSGHAIGMMVSGAVTIVVFILYELFTKIRGTGSPTTSIEETTTDCCMRLARFRSQPWVRVRLRRETGHMPYVSCRSFIGWNEAVSFCYSGIEPEVQREIGTATGAAGSLRSIIIRIAQAVYLTVLFHPLVSTVPNVVTPAVKHAGLLGTSVPAILGDFTTGSYTVAPGLTDSILPVGTRAYKVADQEAYQTVFYTSIVLIGTTTVTAFLSPNVDEKMIGKFAVTLSEKKQIRDKEVEVV
ncbi:fungal trichothecene efflux pump-domain-containing protein [Xylariales sp. AK1849]|nr:fungal trichothecene efflux pump-domain-containing protein [Xylariales sp. AK1849]